MTLCSAPGSPWAAGSVCGGISGSASAGTGINWEPTMRVASAAAVIHPRSVRLMAATLRFAPGQFQAVAVKPTLEVIAVSGQSLDGAQRAANRLLADPGREQPVPHCRQEFVDVLHLHALAGAHHEVEIVVLGVPNL